MSRLHICNTFFEQELAASISLPLKNWLISHPAIRQLQYLPLLYAAPSDCILVSELPCNPDPRLHPMNQPLPNLPLEPWAPSLAIERWAAQSHLLFSAVPFAIAREIQSKAFSFIHAPRLPGAQLLFTQQEVLRWIEKTPVPKVLKQMFGSAGRGHYFPEKAKGLQQFLQTEMAQKRPILCEPWVEKTFDFSSQWQIGERPQLLGLTTFETSPQGAYRGTQAGPLKSLFQNRRWAAELHIESVRPILQTIERMGFKGPLGIDAMLYLQNGQEKLHPIVEINARKTMSWVALQIQQKTPDKILSLRFDAKPGGLLPGSFSRNIFLSYR